MLIGCTVIITSTGASIDVNAMPAPEPMWMHTIVPSSAHALQNGSQCSACRLGSPSFSGFSENEIA